jgi:hypothetical protein
MKVEVAFGNAKFHYTGKGETSVPTSSFYRWMENTFTTTPVDEFNSSRVCAKKKEDGSPCHAVLSKVMEKGDARNVEIRGLRWCNQCRKLVNLNVNAALNILHCWEASLRGESRPIALSRETYHGKYTHINLSEVDEIMSKKGVKRKGQTNTQHPTRKQRKVRSNKSANWTPSGTTYVQ